MPLRPFCWSPPDTPSLGQRWDANSFVFGLDERGTWQALGELQVRFREGTRTSGEDARTLGFYRPSSIWQLALHDDGLSPMPPSWGDLSTVGPGDVVISKFLPVSAAWVTPPTPRRPVDSNCVRVIGLSQEMGFWVANVIGHSSYQSMLTGRAAGSVLPRIGLRELRELRIPNPPSGLEAFVTEWTAASRDLTTALSDIRALQAMVNAYVEADSPAPASVTWQFYAAPSLGGSWLPVHVALESFQVEAAHRGWPRLAEFLSDDPERLHGQCPDALRVLRLGDADGSFGFTIPGLTELRHSSFRIYAHPLEPDEVLLSVLGSSSKVIFHHPARGATVWVADHWVRFKPQSEPGALALLLRSGPVAAQLSLAATGAARQFVPRSELASVRLPWPELILRRRWHSDLSTALERFDDVAGRLAAIRSRVSELVDQCLGGGR